MLPGADCFRTTDFYWFACFQCLDAIGDNSIQSPVATAYHISGSYTGNALAVFFIRSGMKEAPTPGGYGYFSRTFTTGIRIVSAHRFVLPISPDLFPVLVAFIGSYHHAHFYTVCKTNSFKNMDSPHHVGLIGLYRNVITQTYQRLGCQMEHNLGLILPEDFFDTFTVSDVGTDICLYSLPDAGKHKVVTLRKRVLSHTDNFGTQLVQPDGKPATLETGMTGDKHTLPAIEIMENVYHVDFYK